MHIPSTLLLIQLFWFSLFIHFGNTQSSVLIK